MHGLFPLLTGWLYDYGRMAVQVFLVLGGYLSPPRAGGAGRATAPVRARAAGAALLALGPALHGRRRPDAVELLAGRAAAARAGALASSRDPDPGPRPAAARPVGGRGVDRRRLVRGDRLPALRAAVAADVDPALPAAPARHPRDRGACGGGRALCRLAAQVKTAWPTWTPTPSTSSAPTAWARCCSGARAGRPRRVARA
ncbi:hypothetical protein Ddc_19875 [Ditylenchus destructor]|nr:hypothetical protein Ddc_19875 [Ditylenchus destructor]